MQAQERGDDDLAAEDRYRAAALAAAGTSLNVDVIVTNAPTAGRPDVADNDILISVRPEDLIPIFGHYLRSISESRFRIVKGHLVGGGAIESTTGAHSVNELYEMGIDSGMRFFECLLLVSGMARHQSVASALRSIRTRINRAARALDSLLAALSNTNGSGEQTTDATEWAAEAFDRELLYLTAVYDSYGRLYLTLLNQDLRLQDARGTLHSEKFLNDQVEPHFDPALLTDLRSLQQYAYVCAELRNRVHASVLPAGRYLARSYGSTRTVAVDLTDIASFNRDDTHLQQQHFDKLGVWNADPTEAFAGRTLVSDVATMGVTFMTTALDYVDKFSELVLWNKPRAAHNAHPVLGSVPRRPDEQLPAPGPEELFHRALFGWHSP